MAANSRQDVLDQQHERSYRNLENSRKSAKKKTQYDSNKTRNDLARLFRERFGNDPYDWQIDVAEAIILGLDAIVIAGTGSGKTMPFMMPLLIDMSKKVIIISPLKVLQSDQVRPFHCCDNLS
jgi:bloom syndrome protein